MHTLTRASTTDMEVTSIRLERELKERLKEISGNQGYQALIRDILWNYVRQKTSQFTPQVARSEIQSTVSATAAQETRCALTGSTIQPNQPMLLGLTTNGVMVPLSTDSLK